MRNYAGFLPEPIWLSAVAKSHSRGLASIFKRCMRNPCVLEIKAVYLEVGTMGLMLLNKYSEALLVGWDYVFGYS